MHTAIILAGGLGTRLRSVVADVPKCLAPIAGRPFLHLLLGYLSRNGFSRVVLSVGYKHDVIEASVGVEFAGMRIDYSVEATTLGTGGALALACRNLAEEPAVFALNGDTFAEFSAQTMRERARAEGAPLVIALRKVDDVARFGSVELDDAGHALRMQEKGARGPGWINAGVYLLDPKWFADAAPAGAFSFERDFLATYVSARHPPYVTLDARFIDIGVPADYARAQIELADLAT